jgi:hypothetical protein
MPIALLVLVLALVVGCGEDDEEPSLPGGGGGGAAFADLTVTVDPDGDGARPARRASVRCDAPEDSATCRAAGGVRRSAFEPTPGDVACTQQYGGPQTATVEGTLRGEPIDATFSRANGCEIARWQQAAALLDVAG